MFSHQDPTAGVVGLYGEAHISQTSLPHIPFPSRDYIPPIFKVPFFGSLLYHVTLTELDNHYVNFLINEVGKIRILDHSFALNCFEDEVLHNLNSL